MKRVIGFLVGIFLLFTLHGRTHVTFRSTGPLYPRQRATVILNVPNERSVDINEVIVEVPDVFLLAGGRVERIQSVPGWEVILEKQTKPEDVLAADIGRYEERQARRGMTAGPESLEAKAKEEKERQDRLEGLKQWINKITFQGGKVSPDGFVQFPLEVTTPQQRGNFYFRVVQVYADGETVSWFDSESDAERPAATLVVQQRYTTGHLALLGGAFALLILLVRPVKRYKQWKKD